MTWSRPGRRALPEQEGRGIEAIDRTVPGHATGPACPRSTISARRCAPTPPTQRRLVDEGDVDAALARRRAARCHRTYIWPYQMHASIGPSCALADWRGAMHAPHALTVWAGTQNPHVLRADLSRLMGVRRRRHRGGAHGSRRLLRPQLRRRRGGRRGAAVARGGRAGARAAQPRAGAPVGAQGRGAVDAGAAAACTPTARSRPTTSPPPTHPTARRRWRCCSRARSSRRRRPSRWATAPRGRPTTIANLRVTVNDMAPILRASWLRGVSALPNSFAHESYIDELATAAGRRSGRIPAAAPDRTRARTSCCRPPPSAPAGGRTPQPQQQGAERRLAARPGLRLCALRAQQVARLRRGLVGLGGRCRRQQDDRRGARQARRGRP